MPYLSLRYLGKLFLSLGKNISEALSGFLDPFTNLNLSSRTHLFSTEAYKRASHLGIYDYVINIY